MIKNYKIKKDKKYFKQKASWGIELGNLWKYNALTDSRHTG